jgi:Ras-related protein Rab-2A
MDPYRYLFKFIIVGDSNIGKSCLLLRFVDNKYRHNHELTIGVEFGIKIITIDSVNIKLQIWDTAGQESFKSITRSYYKGTAGAILVYDVSQRNTFDHIINWLNDIKKYANQDIPIILVGNKIDLDNREVSIDEGQKLADDNNLLFIETSGKENINIDKLFINLSSAIYNKIIAGSIIPDNVSGVRLSHSTINHGHSKCC